MLAYGAVLAYPSAQRSQSAVTSPQRRLHDAEGYLSAGRPRHGETLCRELRDEGFRSPALDSLFGEILLLRNRPDESESLLRRALAEQGGNPRLVASLAECLRRSDRLGEAADLYRRLGRGGLADKLRYLANGGWYLLPPDAAADLPWLPDAEFPVVEVSVNGEGGHFLLDTGVGETLIDPDLARRAMVRPLGVESIQFPSGPAGRVEHGVVDWMGVGGLAVERVPAQIHPTRDVFSGLLPFPVDGILGTGLFSRLPTTIDYRGRRLRMGRGEALSEGVPFYLAGDQYPLVEARINGTVDTLLFLDTGMIGAALGLPFSTAEAADVEVAAGIAGAGFGIASEMPARPFLCRSLEAAGARRTDLPGMLIGHFRLEHQLGLHVGGLVGDGFVNAGALTLDFTAMHVALTLR